ncbi:holin family protein [Oceanibium sediminis]|uniref:holin family protein n=1 Tax=Oceanibium sediminis TaxID=2026339 RepID=UPI000DD4BEDF|nr:holin family protein [Oceanibium sediminis]
MGLIARLLGLAPAVTGVAEVFVENRTKRAAQDHAEQLAALGQFGAEYAAPRGGWFDGLVNGLNRLPRPAMALGSLALFAFAMVDPVSFGIRMQGLALVPEPLWWLLGAVVSFYFGARELHHFRGPRASVPPEEVADTMRRIETLRGIPRLGGDHAEGDAPDAPAIGSSAPAGANAAIADWRARGGVAP